MATVEHPRVRPGTLEDRAYQAAIAATAVAENTLVVLPTGLGKTAIALRVMAEYLLKQPTRSILLLAPTRPLVVQHATSIAQHLFGPAPLVLTGAIAPGARRAGFAPPQILVATPQVVTNDLVAGGFPLDTLALVIFDEAHRAVGEYPYVALGRALRDHEVRVLALTASPGARPERIREVWANLGIEHFELRTASDPDVLPYTHAIRVEPVAVPVPPEVRHLAILLRTVARRHAEELVRRGFAGSGDLSRRELLAIGELLDRQIAAARHRDEPAPGPVWAARTAQAVAMKAHHAVELAETQGVEALRQYLDRQEADSHRRRSPALRAFLEDPDVIAVRRDLGRMELEHPKVATAVRIVAEELRERPASRVLVFTQYRQTAELLSTELERHRSDGLRPARFVGQGTRAGDEGLSQREQIQLLDQFRAGSVNCLVATSVAEEGLDIPNTDLVVLYEPVPDEIRTIQRRGRTGRARSGRALVLIAEGTRDEGMYRAALVKERRMHEMLERVEREQRSGRAPPPPAPKSSMQKLLTEFPDAPR